MIAVFVNMFAVILGSGLGILFRSRIRETLISSVIKALALVTVTIAITNMIGTEDILCVIVCMVLGTVIGESLRLDARLDNAGDFIKNKLLRGKGTNGRFAEGFSTSCILFCVGSMTIMGSFQAGIHGDYSIIFAKSALDFVSSIAFGAAMGLGVTASALFVLVFQGALTLLATALAPYLSASVVAEMSAVGGVVLFGMGINMLELSETRLKVSNMLPAVILPLAYMPFSQWIISFLS